MACSAMVVPRGFAGIFCGLMEMMGTFPRRVAGKFSVEYAEGVNYFSPGLRAFARYPGKAATSSVQPCKGWKSRRYIALGTSSEFVS
jgi:hypothetical protein